MSLSTTPKLRPLPFVGRPDPCEWHADVTGGICDDCDPYVVMSDAEVHEIGERAGALFKEALGKLSAERIAQGGPRSSWVDYIDVASARWVSDQSTEEWLAECERLDARTHEEVLASIGEQEFVAVAEVPADEPEAEPDADDNLAVLDLRRLRSEPRPERVWLEDLMIAQGQVTKVTAASGVGKTLFLAYLAVRWSLGRSGLDIEDGGPRQLDGPLRVLYIDGEVGEDWWAEYLDKMDAPLDLSNLKVKCFPDWPPLTTTVGAGLFWDLVLHYRPDVVVLDTLSSFIDGDENDASTWIAFDNRITLPLKKAGITTVFADHTGKNTELGARGSSAKRSKIDVEWAMESNPAGSNGLLLRRLKARTGRLPEKVRLLRTDGPLAHVRSGEEAGPVGPLRFTTEAGEPTDEKVREIVAQLDEWNVATKTGRPAIAKRLRAAGIAVKDDAIRAAIAHRRARDER